MQLVDNWRAILKRAWSVWLMTLAGLGEAASIGFVLLVGYAPLWLSIVVLILIAAGVPARLLAQRSIEEPKEPKPSVNDSARKMMGEVAKDLDGRKTP